MAPINNTRPYTSHDHIFILVGNYGSGKTEIAVNLALFLNACGKKVKLADLDVVNPYFRSREHCKKMESAGIRLVIPPVGLRSADLPILVPEIKGMFVIDDPDGVSIFDIGGDDVGARIMASFKALLNAQSYRFLQVINTRRPFTGTVDGCLRMKKAIETTAGLMVNGLIVNSHLCADTTPEIILEGYQVADEIRRQTGLQIEFVSVVAPLDEDPAIQSLAEPLLVLQRMNVPPWMQTEAQKESETGVMGKIV